METCPKLFSNLLYNCKILLTKLRHSYSAWKSTRTGFVAARTLFSKSSLSFTSKGALKNDVVVMCADVPERYFGENNALW